MKSATTMRKWIGILSAGFLALIMGTGALLPWALYWAELETIDGRPAPAANAMSPDEVDALWAQMEPDLKQDEASDISPYWLYSLLWCGTGISACPTRNLGGISQMAGLVALTYMRDGHFLKKGMSRWHPAAASLTIWVQRSMSPSQIAAAYVEAKSHYKPRD